jgi:hypothetical protein
MAYSNAQQTTYADRIRVAKKQIRSLEAQIEAEEEYIASIKTPGSLLRAFLSPTTVRSNQLYQVTQSRSKIAQLKQQLFQTEVDLQEVERLRAHYPAHDQLIEQAAQVSFDGWRIEIQEDELDVYERGAILKERLENKRLEEEEQRLLDELIELDRKQEQMNKEQEELARKKAELSSKRRKRSSSK